MKKKKFKELNMFNKLLLTNIWYKPQSKEPSLNKSQSKEPSLNIKTKKEMLKELNMYQKSLLINKSNQSQSKKLLLK